MKSDGSDETYENGGSWRIIGWRQGDDKLIQKLVNILFDSPFISAFIGNSIPL